MIRAVEATRTMVDTRGGIILSDDPLTNGWSITYEPNRRKTQLIRVSANTYHRLKERSAELGIPMKDLIANCVN